MESKEIVNILGGTQNIDKPKGQFVTVEGTARKSTLKTARTSAIKKRTKGRTLRSMQVEHVLKAPIVFKTRAVDKLSERLAYPKDELLSIINVKGRTAQRREKEGTLSEDESDRLYRLARVTEKAERVFGSTQKAHEWLKSENSVFRGASPLSLLGSDAGAEAVTDELGRIEFGDLF
jgi:putative toxin-antitoxin system antitoxin component (TIGR02293 family)